METPNHPNLVISTENANAFGVPHGTPVLEKHMGMGHGFHRFYDSPILGPIQP